MEKKPLLISGLHNEVHPSWNRFLTSERMDLLASFEGAPGIENYTPGIERILHFLTLPLNKAQVIILGQDPYPQLGVATGRAFEVGTLYDWNQKFSNISLKNIIRLLYKTYTGETRKYKEVMAEVPLFFNILPPNLLFKHWEAQGVLLLNTSFTCEPGAPGSHKSFWAPFTQQLLEYINEERPELYWFLWGNHAEEVTRDIKLRNAFRTFHPMMCYNREDRELDFLYGKINPFNELKGLIDWTGYTSVSTY
ncbi:MAG: uracil-DNA glycosylase [Bacteroidota bacterium]|nr:uracil-DNA glycosylase [Bacteroidota bacterium]MDP4205941.1 uracil-DNA glycosylase [Bacteroidota bacterium]